MNKYLRSIAIASVCAVAAAGCKEPPTAPNASDITVSLSVSTTRFRAVDGTVVRIRVANSSNRAVVLAPDECNMGFEVLSGDHAIVATEPSACPAIYNSRAILPGESFTLERKWHGSDWHWAVELNAGQYQLRGKIFVNETAVMSTPVSVEKLPD